MKKLLISFLAIGTTLFQSCLNNDYLERLPLDKQTEETVFVSYDNFKTYSWKFYTYLTAYAGPTAIKGGPNEKYIFDSYSDNGFYGNPGSENQWVWPEKVTVPSTDDAYSKPYERIRAINIMLDNLDNSQMNETEKAHWRSLGYFFKANEYYRLIAYYGSAIWVENALKDTDTEVLYAKRTPRTELAA